MKQAIKRWVILLIAVMFIFLSCRKSNLNATEGPNNFDEIFEAFWYKMNNNYVYWDIDETDWDAVYKTYKPLFSTLKFDDKGKKDAVKYFTEMTSKLIDGHYRIIFSDKDMIGSVINPSQTRKKSSPIYHAAYNYLPLVSNYLDAGYLTAKGTIVSGNSLISVTTGTINKNVLYFNCNFFALKQSVSAGDQLIQDAVSYFFLKIKSGMDLTGIIIDLRNNQGGNITDLNYFAGKLVTQNTLFGFTRNKTGLGRFSYLPWMESRVAHETAYNNKAPVIVLVDSFTASLAETIVVALKAQNNCIIVGEKTYGASGPLGDTEVYNSGSFTVGNFMTVETSAVEFKTFDNQIIENQGLTPSFLVPFDIRTLAGGVDSQLETALKILNQ